MNFREEEYEGAYFKITSCKYENISERLGKMIEVSEKALQNRDLKMLKQIEESKARQTDFLRALEKIQENLTATIKEVMRAEFKAC
ncbi:hypothetical protein Dda_8540 [Drechslerella dactyloides]|uniref:Uncharacterized protein n=1 Tax=Drechslerella dactyloides TaxID=74499 RepID=A0AAD6NFR7_DREDA|nr:hypothetical protein Dda_8540 [Drechslerella dactyloides]